MSCPPANANLLALEAKRPDILALSWQVTYWDDLGWKDTFSKPAFTARQWDYAHAFHDDNVGTPEVVVNGRADVVGSRAGEIEALIREVDRGVSGPEVQIADGRVTVGAGEGAPMWCWSAMTRTPSRCRSAPVRTAAGPCLIATSSTRWSGWGAGTARRAASCCRRPRTG